MVLQLAPQQAAAAAELADLAEVGLRYIIPRSVEPQKLAQLALLAETAEVVETETLLELAAMVEPVERVAV